MKTILSIALFVASTHAFAADTLCHMSIYGKGVLLKQTDVALMNNDVSCSGTATKVINGTLTMEEGKPDAIEFRYTNTAGAVIKGSLQK